MFRAFDARLEHEIETHRSWSEQALRDIWGAAPEPGSLAAGQAVTPQAPPASYRIDLRGQPALDLIDNVFRQEFALTQHFPAADFSYPTLYCETLEEFFAPWADVLEISESARKAFVAERVQEQRERAQAGQGGIYGVNWPGRGCYLNGWLFAYGHAPNAAAALQDSAILPSIIATAAHEKLGHGFIALCTESGREKQRLDLGRFDLARRFGQRLSDRPDSALLESKSALLWQTSRFLEEGWATWIEHHIAERLCFACDEPAQARRLPPTLARVWEAVQTVRASNPASPIPEALQALAWALDVLYIQDVPSADDVQRATVALQDIESLLEEPLGSLLGQPLRYVLGCLTMRRIEAQQGAFCAPYAVAIAGNVAFGIDSISVADLAHVVRDKPHLNLDNRLFLLALLRLDAPGSLRELAHRAREQLSLTVPDNLDR